MESVIDNYNGDNFILRAFDDVEERLKANESLLKHISSLEVINLSIGTSRRNEINISKENVSQKIENLDKQITELESSYLMKKHNIGNSTCPARSYKVFGDIGSSISLPGLQFVSGPGVNWISRYLWICIHSITLIIAFHYIRNAYETLQTSPVVQSYINTMTKAHEIPFPAVSICLKSELSETYNQTDVLQRCVSWRSTPASERALPDLKELYYNATWTCSEEDLLMLQLSLIIKPIRYDYKINENVSGIAFTKKLRTFAAYKFKYDGETILQNLGKVLSRCYSRYSVRLSGSEDFDPCFAVDNELLMDPPVLHEGFVCRSFNGLPFQNLYKEKVVLHLTDNSTSGRKSNCDNWSPDTMMTTKCSTGNNPLYTASEVSLTIISGYPKKTIDDEFPSISSTIPPIGKISVKVGIYTPADNYQIDQHFVYIDANEMVEIYLNPKLITTKDDFSKVDVSSRKCYFSDEKILLMFQFYTRKNCLTECRALCALMECGCIPFNYPRPNISVKVCDVTPGSSCNYKISKDDYYMCDCDCLPDCVSLVYDTEVRVVGKSYEPGISTLSISFKNKEFPSTVRHTVTSFSEFVAYSVGILGVFSGFSIIVVWELLYLVTLRLWISIKHTLSIKHKCPENALKLE